MDLAATEVMVVFSYTVCTISDLGRFKLRSRIDVKAAEQPNITAIYSQKQNRSM